MNTTLLPALVTCSCVLVGCAVSPEAQLNSLNATSICCKTYVEIPINVMSGAEHTYEINSSSPIFVFSGNRSHFAAIALPASSSRKTLVMRTMGGAPTVANGLGAHLYFYPVATFLNTSKEYISTQQDDRPSAELYGWAGQASFVSKVKIPPEAAYAVIHTTTSKVGATYVGYTTGPGFTTMAGGTLISQGGGTSPMRAVFSSTGTVSVSIAP